MKKVIIISVLLVAALAANVSALDLSSQPQNTAPAASTAPAEKKQQVVDTSSENGFKPVFWGQQKITVVGDFHPTPGDTTLKSSDEIKSGTESIGSFISETIGRATWNNGFFVKEMVKAELKSTGNFFYGQTGLGWSPTVGDWQMEVCASVGAPLAKFKTLQPGLSFWAGNGFVDFSVWGNTDISLFGSKQNVVSMTNVWTDGTDERKGWAVGGAAGVVLFDFLHVQAHGSYGWSNDQFGPAPDKKLKENPRTEIGADVGVKTGGAEFGVGVAKVTGGEVLPYIDKTDNKLKPSDSYRLNLSVTIPIKQ